MKRIEAEWQSYKTVVIPHDAPEVQICESKKAFYAGANSLFHLIINLVDPKTSEPTEKDLESMDELNKELNDFLDLLKKGVV